MTDKPQYIQNIGYLICPESFKPGLPSPLKTLNKVWLEIRDGKIRHISQEGEKFPESIDDNVVFDAKGAIAAPGFVDAHTHPVFMNSRESEFIRRCRGESYQEIAASGGGILSSIKGVRESSLEQLTEKVKTHFDRFVELGITTIEAKSGYGLTVKDEIKSLRALKIAAESHPLDVSTTLLGAHVIPPEYKDKPEKYVDLIIEEMLPMVAAEGLAEGLDVFVEEGAFSVPQAKRIFSKGKEVGMHLHIHADQFNDNGGARLAIELGARTADHMDKTSPEGFQDLSKSNVCVVLLPGSVFFLGLDKYSPGRKIIDSGCRIALATDFNPGSTPSQSMTFMMTLACIKMGLSPEEALWASTMGGAIALARENDTGSLFPGFKADICFWNIDNIAQIPYYYATMVPEYVFKKGTLVSSRGKKVRAITN